MELEKANSPEDSKKQPLDNGKDEEKKESLPSDENIDQQANEVKTASDKQDTIDNAAIDDKSKKTVEGPSKSTKEEKGKELPVFLCPPTSPAESTDERRWTFWYQEGKSGDAYYRFEELGSFETLDEFYTLYRKEMPPSKLSKNHDYFVFKKGIRPKLNEPMNKDGGRWQVNVEKLRQENKFDECWLELVKALVSGSLVASDELRQQIAGIAINIRPLRHKGREIRQPKRFFTSPTVQMGRLSGGAKISLWTLCADDAHDASNRAIGQALADKMGIVDEPPLLYFTARDLNVRKGKGSYKEANIGPKLVIGTR